MNSKFVFELCNRIFRLVILLKKLVFLINPKKCISLISFFIEEKSSIKIRFL